jgi:hypothetical protein
LTPGRFARNFSAPSQTADLVDHLGPHTDQLLAHTQGCAHEVTLDALEILEPAERPFKTPSYAPPEPVEKRQLLESVCRLPWETTAP